MWPFNKKKTKQENPPPPKAPAPNEPWAKTSSGDKETLTGDQR